MENGALVLQGGKCGAAEEPGVQLLYEERRWKLAGKWLAGGHVRPGGLNEESRLDTEEDGGRRRDTEGDTKRYRFRRRGSLSVWVEMDGGWITAK